MWEADGRPKLTQLHKQKGHPIDLPNALVRCGDAFERLRYAYEEPENVIYYI